MKCIAMVVWFFGFMGFLVYCMLCGGCASAPTTFTITPPEGPFCVLDGQNVIGVGNLDGNEAWFHLANAFPVQLHRSDFGYKVTYELVEIERDTGVHQDDLEGKSFRRTVVMTARPSATNVFRTKDGRGIILVQETSGLGYETRAAEKIAHEVVRVLSVSNEETTEVNLADLPDDNVFVIMIANGENEGEVVVRKHRRGSERTFVGITTSLDSVLTLVGVLHLYLPTYEQQPRLNAEAEQQAAEQAAEDLIRELDEKYGSQEQNKGE